VDDLPLEYQFCLHNPLVLSIEVRSSPAKRPRTKQILYMRERVREIKLPRPRRTDRQGNLIVEGTRQQGKGRPGGRKR
jgi:hypothetical protein